MSEGTPEVMRSPKRLNAGKQNKTQGSDWETTGETHENKYHELKKHVREGAEKQQNHKYMQLSKEFLSFRMQKSLLPAVKEDKVGNKLSDFTIIKEIGSGATGTVYHVRCGVSGKEFALKKIAVTKNSKDVLNEVMILKSIKHPNLIKYFQYFNETEPPKGSAPQG